MSTNGEYILKVDIHVNPVRDKVEDGSMKEGFFLQRRLDVLLAEDHLCHSLVWSLCRRGSHINRTG